ncbi:UNVERIFIED_CONTAM: putative late blight resistance proteinR1B-17 [Sesamum radiatum]|uniref:Late blight resistance proteinR1B-17 n=1 Tax=Sesamum radiatum TaxID=300843 RepID=A0AAW2RY60_SESRA
MKKIKDQLSNSSLPEEDDTVVLSTTDHVGGKKSMIFGLDNELSKLKDLLVRDESPSLVIPIVGMSGIGKTTLAKEVYGDPDIVSHFEHRIFVSLGPECAWRKILLSVLAQINCGIDETHVESNAELAVHMYNSLWGSRYLIVLDDIWDNMVWAVFRRYLPDNGNGSRIMLTTRSQQVARYVNGKDGGFILKKRFLNDEESWHLLREKVLAKEWLLPPELEKAGRKIAKKCEGLPLAIIAVAKHLCQAEKTLEYWKKVAKEVHSVVGADKELSKVLSLSYYYLPECLKPCFVLWEFSHMIMRSQPPSSSACGVLEDFLNQIGLRSQKILPWNVWRSLCGVMSFESTSTARLVELKLATSILSFGIYVYEKLRKTSFSIL